MRFLQPCAQTKVRKLHMAAGIKEEVVGLDVPELVMTFILYDGGQYMFRFSQVFVNISCSTFTYLA